MTGHGVLLMTELSPGSSQCVTCGAVDMQTAMKRRNRCCRLKRKRFGENIQSIINMMKAFSQVTITVIGSDSRKAAAESAFENCRLVVDASVYI